MKVALEKNIENPISSFTLLELKEPYFDPNWHFHPHYQLFTVLEGTGTRLIGDSIEHFEPGETVFLGPNMPHLWRSDKEYFQNNSDLNTHGIVLYFTESFFGNFLEEKPESRAIQQLLKNSYRGLSFRNKTKDYLINELKSINEKKGFDRIIGVLSILNKLSKSEEYNFITSISYRNSHKVSETERMQKVYDYVMQHFKHPIKLSEVSDIAAMSESAFCRYFKKRSNKTFSDFLAEIRIGNACKLIAESDLSINQICYESGFNTLSNFNRKFKEITHKTPSVYLKEIKFNQAYN